MEGGMYMGKKLLFRAISAAVTVLFCISATALTAYAYFATTLHSSTTLTHSASFLVTVQVTPEDGGAYTQGMTDAFSHQIVLQPGVYSLQIALAENNTANTGFCRVLAGGNTYCTGQLGVKGDTFVSAVTFQAEVLEETVITVSTRWGTCANCSTGELLLTPQTVLKLGTANISEDIPPVETPTEVPTETSPTEEAVPAVETTPVTVNWLTVALIAGCLLSVAEVWIILRLRKIKKQQKAAEAERKARKLPDDDSPLEYI
jgi:hypothetical protein